MLELDANGHPVLLADVPNSGVVRVDANARSGNPRHDARSGKFGSGGGAKKQAKPNPDHDAEAARRRRQDAVRDAARSLDDLTAETAAAFLEDRVTDANAVDVDAFVRSVALQRLDDLADALYGRLRSDTIGDRPHLVAPDGWVNHLLGTLNDASMGDVLRRLQARGVDSDEIGEGILDKIDDEGRRDRLKSLIGGVEGS